MFKQIIRSVSCAAVLLLLVTSIVSAQRRGRGSDEEGAATRPPEPELMTRVYRVMDLVLPTPDYSFKGVQLPGTSARPGGVMGGGMGGMGGGTMGGMGGMSGGGFGGGAGSSGGGMFKVAPQNVFNQMGGGGMAPAGQPSFTAGNKFQINMDDLIETITSTVDPNTWDEVGGRGSIASLGGLLVVQQTAEVHIKLATLLDTLRESGAVPKAVTIRAMWLAGENDSIVSFENRTPRELTKEVLAKHSEKIVARGQITCFDSQTVHIIAGELRSAVTSYIPVVGQNESDADVLVAQSAVNGSKQVSIPAAVLAQTGGAGAGAGLGGGIVRERESNVGYQPVTQTMNLGMLLQVTPLLIADGQSVAVDVHSIVVSPTKEPSQVDFKTGMKLDRIDLSTQQFKTTLRMPLNQATVVSGMTMQPTSTDKDQQLILILEVFAN